MTKQIKFYCLQRDFQDIDSFSFCKLEEQEQEKAWEEIQENISTNTSQEWLLTKEEVKTIIKLLQDGIK